MEQAVTQQTRSAKWEAIWQFIKFGMIGAMNTLINYGVYSFCYYVLKTNVHIGNFFGFTISVFSAFLLQSRFVFIESKDAAPRV